MYMFCMHVFSVQHVSQKRVLELRELQSWTVVICSVGDSNATQVLYKQN